MSIENVKKMFAMISEKADFQKKYTSAIESARKESQNVMIEKLIKFGATNGFAFSKDDMAEARRELLDGINSNGELSESDLAGVSGGMNKSAFIMSSVFTAGMFCAIASISAAIASANCTDINIDSQNYQAPPK